MTVVAATLLWVISATPAHACRINNSIDPRAAKEADVVVVGRITDYQPPDTRGPVGSKTRRARFNVVVERFVLGRSLRKIPVFSPYEIPDRMRQGRYLIAPARPGSPSGPSNRAAWRRDPQTQVIDLGIGLNEWTPLQELCSTALIMPIESTEAHEALRALNADKKAE